MLHAATLEYGGKAYAFCAKSGTGKSTHTALWKNMLGDNCRYINGDKPIIRIIDGVARAFGNSWNGKEGFGESISAPLSGICFIVRSDTPEIRRLDTKEALFHILPAVHIPKDHKMIDATYSCVETIIETVPIYELKCNIFDESARLSFETMTGNI